MAKLTADEQAQLDALQAKLSQPEDDDAGDVAEGAAEVAAEVGAQTVETIGEVAAVIAEIVDDVHRDREEELRAEANVAKVEAAVATMRAEDAEQQADSLVQLVEERATEPITDVIDEPTEITVEEGAAAVVIDAAPGADVEVNDSAPAARPHPYFSPIRMPWTRKPKES